MPDVFAFKWCSLLQGCAIIPNQHLRLYMYYMVMVMFMAETRVLGGLWVQMSVSLFVLTLLAQCRRVIVIFCA